MMNLFALPFLLAGCGPEEFAHPADGACIDCHTSERRLQATVEPVPEDTGHTEAEGES